MNSLEQEIKPQSDINEENFDVVISTSVPKEDTVIVTTSELAKQRIETAMRNYNPQNTMYSTYLKDLGAPPPFITKQELDELAINTQNDLKKVMRINEIARVYVNKNWIIGKFAEIIDTNVNSEYRLSYNDFSGDEDKFRILQKAQVLIQEFNDKINIRHLIKAAIPTVFIEGNYLFVCRENTITRQGNPYTQYVFTYLPLGVVEVSDYEINGEPQLLIDMKKLLARIKKPIKKDRKNKALFYDKLEQELKDNYPIEVYKAYVAKESYAILNINWTGAVRINSQNRKYGVTPIFRALYPLLVLEQFDDTDKINAKAKAKKFIVQLLRKELMGKEYDRDSYEQMAYAHDNLLQAFKQPTVLVTPPSYVEDIKYVEPSVTSTDSNTVQTYVNRVLSTLGVSFLMNTNSTGASVASISLDQLMKTINSASEQLEYILEKFYRNLLYEHGISSEYAPKVTIVDSELLEMSVKQDLAKLLYGTFNSSMDTALSVLGIDVNDEKNKRIAENEANLDQVFTPHASQYTASSDTKSDNQSGRPSDDSVETIDKRTYDENYNTYNRK